MIFSRDLYIDLGTANTIVYGKNRGLLLNEPSVFAVRQYKNKSSSLYSIGQPAKKMLGKNPEEVSVIRPLHEGVIADVDSTAKMLAAFLKRVKETLHWYRPRIIISLPCEVTRFEKQAVEDVGYSLGAGKVYLLDEPMVAAIGSGVKVLGSEAQMVVDIGGGTTEIAVISLGGIISSTAVRIGGNNIDQAIIHYLRTQENFIIGEQTAERVKIEIGSLIENDNRQATIGGFDTNLGLPRKLSLSSQGIFPTLDSVVKEIILGIRKILEVLPPEVSADVSDKSIVLTGGGAMISGLSARVERDTGIAAYVAKDPLFSVALGGAKALENNKLFDALEKPA